MISSVQGILESRGEDWVDVAVGGVGVRAQVPSSALAEIGPIGSPVRLYTHLIVRDEAITLYGFRSAEERAAFVALLGVSGIGPRLGLVILSVLTPGTLVDAIEQGDAAALARAPGVGKRSASRIIVELKGKLDELDIAQLSAGPARPPTVADAELTAVLQSLGYTGQEIRQAVTAVSGAEADDRPPLDERVRLALAALSGLQGADTHA